jgi:hypothetical protein
MRNLIPIITAIIVLWWPFSLAICFSADMESAPPPTIQPASVRLEGIDRVQGDAVQSKVPKVLTPAEFEDFRFKVGETAIEARIHPGLPKYVFHLVPDVDADDPNGLRQHVGRIQISKGHPGAIAQTIDVFAEGAVEFFVRQFEIVDVNNDGYWDIGTCAEFGGAKWGRWQYWVSSG